MPLLELATLSIRTGTAAAAVQGIERYTNQYKSSGKLAGVWTAEIGGLNRILVLRSFDACDELFSERARTIESGDYFGASDELVDCTFEIHSSSHSSPARLARSTRCASMESNPPEYDRHWLHGRRQFPRASSCPRSSSPRTRSMARRRACFMSVRTPT